MLDEILLLNPKHLLDHRRIAEQHDRPRTNLKPHQIAILASAAREERQLVAAKLNQIADHRPRLRARRIKRLTHGDLSENLKTPSGL